MAFSKYHSKQVVEAEQVSEDGVVNTQNGPVPVSKGDYVVRTENGSLEVREREPFEDSFSPHNARR